MSRVDPVPPASSPAESEIRWDEAGAFLRRRLERELPRRYAEPLEDLVQESLVRLLRVMRREPVLNLEALMTEIARRTAIDALRRRTRWSLILSPETADLDAVPDPRAAPEPAGDPVERLRFVVLEFFVARDARCQDLAAAYFAEQDWKQVAAATGRSHEAVRKQWSRCIETLRAAAHADPSLLMDWAHAPRAGGD